MTVITVEHVDIVTHGDGNAISRKHYAYWTRPGAWKLWQGIAADKSKAWLDDMSGEGDTPNAALTDLISKTEARAGFRIMLRSPTAD